MVKDVKRALLLWPAIASTAIVAATTLPMWWTTDANDFGTSMTAGSSLNGSDSARRSLQSVADVSGHFRLDVDGDDADRLEYGCRGLSMPSRLQSAASLQSSSESAGGGILLAPVLDPVAELAGYSGLASEPKSTTPLRTKVASAALPSRLSPGQEDPLTATGGNQNQWMRRRNPISSWNAVAIGRAMAEQPRLLNDIVPEVNATVRNDSLIPRSVQYLARPRFEQNDVPVDPLDRLLEQPIDQPTAKTPRVFKVVGNAWPEPKQLQRDLAFIAASADIADGTLGDNQPVFASLESNDSQNGTSIQRHATSIVMGRWADQVESTINELRSLPRIGDERSGVLIRRLSTLSEAGLQLAERAPARDQQITWLRAAHACSRRSSVWAPIFQLVRQGEANVLLEEDSSVVNPEVLGLVDSLRHDIDRTNDPTGWDRFLLLDEIESAFSSNDSQQRVLVAQRVLSRLNHHLLTARHQQWLARPSVRKLAVGLQVWTAHPIDYKQLLEDIERNESDSIDLSAISVGEAFQTLRFSDDAAAARVAKAIDRNYRNANVRTAISLELINRLLPAVPEKAAAVNTTVMGNRVQGTSRVDSRLSIDLNPSKDSWSVNLNTLGNVSTNSRSEQAGVTVLTSGQNLFRATTPLIISPQGYRVGGTSVDVSGDQRMSGVRSRYDGWPLVGSLVRGIAESRFEEAKPVADRISRSQIQSEVTSELQTQLAQQTAIGERKWDEFVFGPLGRLNLQPRVIDLETTPDRLIARYRLAGDWQLASHTPRPRAWNDSWMSVQIHQSAINNTLERLLPTGRAQTFGEFFDRTMDLFGRDEATLPEEIPANAMIEFAGTRPITIEMNEGKATLTLRVVSLSQDEGTQLNRFIVRATYRPEIDGLKARLVRDGHLSVSGPGMSMRTRIAVRVLFNKILSESRTIPLTLPRLAEHPATQDLAINQLELRDGWLALAVGPASSPAVAIATAKLSAGSAVPR